MPSHVHPINSATGSVGSTYLLKDGTSASYVNFNTNSAGLG